MYNKYRKLRKEVITMTNNKREIPHWVEMILTIAIGIGLGIGLYAWSTTQNQKQEKLETYAITTVVVEVNEQDNLVACEDCNGNIWTFYGVEDWQEGDFATLTMNTCGTVNIYDDEIVTARYSGNVEDLK